MQTYGFYLIYLLIQVATSMDFSSTLEELLLLCAAYSVDCRPRMGSKLKKKKNTGRIYNLI